MRTILCTFTLIMTSLLTAQVSDMISMGAGYTNQSFYSLQDGEVANVSNTDWDIAFMSDAFNSSILVNANNGTEVYLYGNDIAEWNSIDTTGLDRTPLHNSELSWEEGALLQLGNEGNPFDYGWGEYNIVTHVVTGNKIFIVKLSDGSYRKLIIEELDLGTYTFKYADLDGGVEVEETVAGADYASKNFWYYSLLNGEIIDREPASDTWEISFTRYISQVIPGSNYLVTGVLHNTGIETAEAWYTDVDDAEWGPMEFSTDINTIGYDWKWFNMDVFAYEVADSLSYFIKDFEGNVWQVIFTDFAGTGTGDISFTKEMVSATGLDEQGMVDFSVFPNPSNGQVNVVLDVEDAPIRYTVIDLNGAVVAQDTWYTGFQHNIDLQDIGAGLYLLQVEKDGALGQQRLVIQ